MQYIMFKRVIRWSSGWIALLMIGAMLGFLPVSVASAASLTVTKAADTSDGACNSDCSLREAISAANSAPGADTISLPAGTYTLAIAGTGEDGNTTGDLDIAGDLTITGALSSTTIIDGGALDRVLHVLGGANVTIRNVTIRNGDAHLTTSATNPGGAGIANYGTLTLRDVTLDRNVAYVENNGASTGGGLYNAGTLTVENSRLTNNTAARGGAIFNAGTLAVNASVFDRNSAHRDINSGGAIATVGQLTLTNSTLTNNFAENFVYHGAGLGGALDLGGATTINGSLISGNTADGGGGISVEVGINVSIANSTIRDNKAQNRDLSVNDGRGGGVLALGTNDNSNTIVAINDSTVSGNQANYGGGVWNGTNLRVSRSTLKQNSAQYDGGGIWSAERGVTNLYYSTVDSNQASLGRPGGNGGGVFNDRGQIFADNSTISRNNSYLGGGVANNALLVLTTSTLSGNTAYNGAAISGSGGANIRYSTIATNTAVLSGILIPSDGGIIGITSSIIAATTCSAPAYSEGYNVDSGNTCGLNQTTDKHNADPKLGPLADNGGPTLTHKPQPGSAAIDAGSCPNSMYDQRGALRPQGAACDAGSVEIFALSPASLPNGVVGEPYRQYVSALGMGRYYYSYTVTSGSLPPGLTLSSILYPGLISGTPTTAGTYHFTITANGNELNTGSSEYTIVISGPTTGGGFPNLPVLDSFDRANGPLGSNWSGDVGGYQIIKNEVDVLGGGGIYWNKASFGARQAAFVTLRKVDPNAREIDLILKSQTTTSDYRKGILLVSYNPRAKAVQIASYRPGAGWIDSPTQPLTLADGDTFGSTVDELGVVRVFKNGQLAATFTLSSAEQQFFNGKGGAIGLWFIDGGNAVFDNFGGGNGPS